MKWNTYQVIVNIIVLQTFAAVSVYQPEDVLQRRKPYYIIQKT